MTHNFIHPRTRRDPRVNCTPAGAARNRPAQVEDRDWKAPCDNFISALDKSAKYRYDLPSKLMTREDAHIYYWEMADERFPDRPDHRVYLKNALRVRGKPEDKALIDKLAEDMKRMKIPDSL